MPTSSTTPRTGPSCSSPILRGKAQVVYGSRFTGERKNMMPLHWIGNRFLSLVTNLLYSSTLSDMETCYKLFDRRVLEGITIESDKFDFEPEITAKVLRRGLPDLRGPDLLRRPGGRRGQEDHLAGRVRCPEGAGQVPVHPDRQVTGAPGARRSGVTGGRPVEGAAHRPVTGPATAAAGMAVVVVNYESGPALARCVDGLRSEGPAELVVVDNGSADGSLAAAPRSVPRGRGGGPGTQPRVRRGRQPGCGRHHRAARSWSATPTSRSARGAGRPGRGAGRPTPGARWSDP